MTITLPACFGWDCPDGTHKQTRDQGSQPSVIWCKKTCHGCAEAITDALLGPPLQELPPPGDAPLPAEGPPHPPPFSQAKFLDSLQVALGF